MLQWGRAQVQETLLDMSFSPRYTSCPCSKHELHPKSSRTTHFLATRTEKVSKSSSLLEGLSKTYLLPSYHILRLKRQLKRLKRLKCLFV